VLAIRHLADRLAQHVFADVGTFMLDRTVKSLTGADETLVQGASCHPVEKTERRCAEKTVKLFDLEDHLTSLH
jgi:hypothetical protein